MSTRWACFLRGINVGGHRKVPMAELRSALVEAGFAQVSSYIQSGNVLVESGGVATTAEEVATIVSATVERAFGHDDVPVVARPVDALAGLVTANPFPEVVAEPEPQPKLLHVFLCHRAPSVAAEGVDLDPQRFAPDRFALVDDAFYVHYPEGAARTKLTLPVIEKALGVTATGRNWSTITKMIELGQTA